MAKSIGDYEQKVKIEAVNGVYWEDQPAGLWQRFLTKIHMNFTRYQITEDELVVIKGLFKKHYDTHELYVLKDVDMSQSLYQQLLKIGTISVIVDASTNSSKAGTKVEIKNIRKPDDVRRLLRDAIEDDVMERGINYFDKI